MSEKREAGHALDLEVAAAVFGTRILTDDDVREEAERIWAKQPLCTQFSMGFGAWRDADGVVHWHQHVPAYSTTMGAAWQVVEKMHNRGFRFAYGGPFGDDDAHEADFETSNASIYAEASAPTAPLAICFAALKAIRAAEGSQSTTQDGSHGHSA